ncbi:MAG: hypothetical protein IKO84_08090 [Butyrivibrio sp.]|nr:hypothetical protein [Butyrivibrio sp.]
MKRRQTTAILIASTMMLTLIGCGKTSEGETPVSADNEISVSESSGSSDTTALADSTTFDSSDDSFIYNGNKISILNDAALTLGYLGDYETDASSTGGNYKNYLFDGGDIRFDTSVVDGNESPVYLYIHTPEVKTSRNVGVGSNQDEIIASYGDPDKKTDDGILFSFEYHFDTYNITFRFDEQNKESVDMVMYTNNYYLSKTAFS